MELGQGHVLFKNVNAEDLDVCCELSPVELKTEDSWSRTNSREGISAIPRTRI
jgi:hypothetical protein